MEIKFALTGNQNCGKTTLFNQLTGSNQHVGNFPGVTVEKKEGVIRGHKNAVVVDLPGIYSLSPYTSEEVVTRDFVLNEKPDCIINIVDATNLERNLYLTLQLTELHIPMIVALNMMDEVAAGGTKIDIAALSERFGVDMFPISASKNQGVGELIERAIKLAKSGEPPKRQDFCTGEVHKAIHAMAHLAQDHAQRAGVPVRFAATKLIEGDEPMLKALNLHQSELDILDHIVDELEQALGTDREAALVDMRYSFIEDAIAQTVVKHGDTPEQLRSEKMDRVLTNKYAAIPIFIAIMGAVFYLTFGLIGAYLSDVMGALVEYVTVLADSGLAAAGVSPWLHSLVIDGAFAGIGSVLSFMPTIVVLFIFLSLLEDSGYMARVAFVMDKLLRRIGLSGRSFVPMLIGFGCSVPAIMATRTLSSDRDRHMTILLVPFMSCSAKLPIYALFTAAFFKSNQALVMISLYLLGIFVAILIGLLLKNTLFRGESVPFIMELPAYRLPSAKTLLIHAWEKAKDFLKRAFTLIFIASIVIWLLQSFDMGFNMVSDSSRSILAAIGSLVAPVFAPLGFGTWQASTALITGLSAKEAVLSTFSVLYGVGSEAALAEVLRAIFTPQAAYAFLTFCLLYMPCVAAFAAVKREMGSAWYALGAMAFQTLVAWCVAFVVYRAGCAFAGAGMAGADIAIAAVLAALIAAAVIYSRKMRMRGSCCGSCTGCPHSRQCSDQLQKKA